MPLLKNSGHRARIKFSVINGGKFYGVLSEVPDTTRVTNMNSPRRLLYTRPKALVSAGNVIIDPSKTKWLVGYHGTGYYDEAFYNVFKLFHVDKMMDWKRRVTSKHPTSGLQTKAADRNFVDPKNNKVYVSLEQLSDISDEFKIDIDRRKLITNLPIKVGDYLDDWNVDRVDNQVGLYICEAH